MEQDHSDVGRQQIQQTNSQLTWQNRLDHVLARLGIRRGNHRVAPGLYRLGVPDAGSPVLVTANYSLSFDALRSALAGHDAYLLVLDTNGVNVWCAAGKGTFGTDELVRRVQQVGVSDLVSNRTLILPQLGASGVSALEVRKRCGFGVEYGPVRAVDLPAYLKDHRATPEMRQVRFDLVDRLTLIPVEVVSWFLPTLLLGALLLLLGGWRLASAAISAMFAGVVLFPILLPWLPTRDFTSKGFFLGGLMVVPFAAAASAESPDLGALLRVAQMLAYFTLMPTLTAYLSLNFTGSTPVASRTGVRYEIDRYVPVMAILAVAGIVSAIAVAAFGR